MCDRKHKRNFLSIPPGKGKSRVIAAVIVLMNEYSATRDFTIVFTTELLKSVDQRVYEILSNLLDINIEQVVFDKRAILEGQLRRDSFILIDEADQILLDHAETLPHENVLALSATTFTKKMIYEQEFLAKSKFRCIDSKISGAIDPATVTAGVSL